MQDKNKIGILIGIFFTFIFIMFFISPMDSDLGWHLKCGENFWVSGSFCGENFFSTFLSNYTWPNHAWIYQAIIFFIFSSFGFFGLSLLNSIILTGSFALLFFSVKNREFEKIFFILLIMIFGWGIFSLGLRSQIFGILFFAFEIFLFFKYAENIKVLYLFPVLFLIWANFHGSVLIGLLIFGIFLFRETIFKKINISKSLLIFFLSFLVILINPFGFEIYFDSFRHFLFSDIGWTIAEWTPASFWTSFCIVLITIYILYESFKNYKNYYKFLSLFILIFSYVSINSRRNIPFYFMVLFFVYFSLENRTFVYNFFNIIYIKKIFGILVIFFLLISILFYLSPNIDASFNYEKWCSRSYKFSLNYPCKGAELLSSKPSGNVFNAFEWGGFLIWKTPKHKVFIDGRMSAWETPTGKGPYLTYLEIIQAKPGWNRTLTEYNISYLVIGSGTFMDLEIVYNSKKYPWNEIYRDEFSVVYEKRFNDL